MTSDTLKLVMTSVEGSVGALPKNEMVKLLSSQHSNPAFRIIR